MTVNTKLQVVTYFSIGTLITVLALTQSHVILKAWQINQLRLGVKSMTDLASFTPTTDCRLVLIALEQGDIQADSSIEELPCLAEDTVVSDLIRLRLAELYYIKGGEADAVRILKNSNKLSLYLLQQSANLVEQGTFPDAQRVLASVEGWSGYPSTGLHLSGAIALGLGDQTGALDAWQQALTLNAYHPDLTERIHSGVTAYEMGKVAANVRDWELAREAFSFVVELNPHNPFGWMRLGLAHLNGFNDLEQAEYALHESLKWGDIDWAHFGLGKTLEAQGRDVEAIDEMLIAFRMTRSLSFRDRLLSLLDRTENRRAAFAACIELSALAPNDVSILAACAKVATEVGEIERAIDLYQRASAIEENASWRQSIRILTEQLLRK